MNARRVWVAGAAALAVLLTGCTDAQHARDLLQRQGYTEIEIGGYDFFGCSEDDPVRTRFTALSPTGVPISGTVCKGIVFKNATLRFD